MLKPITPQLLESLIGKQVKITFVNGKQRTGRLSFNTDPRSDTVNYPISFKYEGPRVSDRVSESHNMISFTTNGTYYVGDHLAPKRDPMDIRYIEEVRKFTSGTNGQSFPHINLKDFEGELVLADLSGEFRGANFITGVVTSFPTGNFRVGDAIYTQSGVYCGLSSREHNIVAIRNTNMFTISRDEIVKPADPQVSVLSRELRMLTQSQREELASSLPQNFFAN